MWVVVNSAQRCIMMYNIEEYNASNNTMMHNIVQNSEQSMKWLSAAVHFMASESNATKCRNLHCCSYRHYSPTYRYYIPTLWHYIPTYWFALSCSATQYIALRRACDSLQAGVGVNKTWAASFSSGHCAPLFHFEKWTPFNSQFSSIFN